jgi:hypothetical protein
MDFEKQIRLISLEISNELKRFEESLILCKEPNKGNKFIDFQKMTLPATNVQSHQRIDCIKKLFVLS